MPEQILAGGLNATKRKLEETDKIENITKEEPKKPTKKRGRPSKNVEPPTEEVNMQEELKKTDNLPESISSEPIVEDGKVKFDMSAVFGPGTYAEIEGEEAEQFLKDQAVGKNPVEAITEEIKKSQDQVSNQILEDHENNDDESTDTEDEISPEIMAAGNPNCYAYMSLKATGIYKPDIISFGLVTEEGKAFYAEMNDVDIMKITPDTLVNVIQKRFNLKKDDIIPGRVCVVGDADYIRSHLLNWIREEFTDKGLVMQIVSDKVSNEFALFLELLLNGIPLNQYANIISPVCIDLNSILAGSINIEMSEGMDKDTFLKGYNPTYIALDVDRLSITGDATPIEYLGNALVNAQAIRATFRRLYGLDKDEEHVDLIKKKGNTNE